MGWHIPLKKKINKKNSKIIIFFFKFSIHCLELTSFINFTWNTFLGGKKIKLEGSPKKKVTKPTSVIIVYCNTSTP